MSRIDARPRGDLADREPLFTAYEQVMGLVPETLFTLARVPGLMEGYVGMAHAAAMNGLITEELAQMVANIASAAAGCRYCQAHTAAHAEHLGVDSDKLAHLWSFETSDHFDDAERAALRLALHAGQHPNAATDADFDDCRRHYTDDQITAIVAVCALFGFLNRWNDTMATTLEAKPLDTAERLLTPQGWDIDKHG
jgi:alkylhydroperoxidase family enzyme